jgi:hypothetical protein
MLEESNNVGNVTTFGVEESLLSKSEFGATETSLSNSRDN